MTPQLRTSILIIEDDEAVRGTLADMIELNGFQAVTANDGVAGFAAAKHHAPSLIITDVAMPGMTGFELLEQIRHDETLRNIPVIVISAKVDRAATRQGMELGAADFITKPFTEDEVMRSIAARLEKKELVDELDAFAHTVAHDLKSPLATLHGRLELAAMMLGKVDESTMRHHLAEATTSAKRLNDIIEELLVLAGVRRQAIAPASLDMAAITAESVDRLESLLKQHPATIRFPAAWPAAVGHAPWVTEVWVNFISNAAKYGGPDALITLGGESNPDGASARFWVQDAGPGLDDAAQAQMFVPFTRVSKVRAKGHGLGLSIVRRIVEKLGGQVGVESRPGAGARFWFELPTKAPEPPPATKSAVPLLFAP
jgi:signal transduction histidine kinase